MQRLEVSSAVRPLQSSLGVKGLIFSTFYAHLFVYIINSSGLLQQLWVSFLQQSFKTLLVVSLTYMETTWTLFCNGQLVQAALWATLAHSKAKLQCNGNKATPSFKPFLIEKVSQKCLPSGLYSQLCVYRVSGGRQPQLHQNDDNCTYYAMTKQHNYYLLYCKAQHRHYHTWTTNYITQVSPNVTDRSQNSCFTFCKVPCSN